MPKKKNESILLSWLKLVPISEGQDPLGMNLRVSSRLGVQLLYCITSITPRARYYSLIPWALSMTPKLSVSRPQWDLVKYIERAFAVGCINSHEGEACKDGRLIGSNIIRRLFRKHQANIINIDALKYAKIPATNMYFRSLANLRLFNIPEGMEEIDDENEAEKITLDRVELSPLGQELANAYDQVIRQINPIKFLRVGKTSKLSDLGYWGRAGCLCSIRKGAPDQIMLRRLMFNQAGFDNRSHEFRRYSLMLILHLVDQIADIRLSLSTGSFGSAVYFGSILDDSQNYHRISWPSSLNDIAMRWRMFYFHYYLTAALENLFVNIVHKANEDRLKGTNISDFLKPLSGIKFASRFEKLLGGRLKEPFLELTPRKLFASFGVDLKAADHRSSRIFDDKVDNRNVLSEVAILDKLESKEYLFTPEGIALAFTLCITVIMRYIRWDDTRYGGWTDQAVKNAPALNVAVPVVIRELINRWGDFWNISIGKLADHIIQRFIIRQHLWIAIEKSGPFFYVDGDRIIGLKKRYEKPAYGNPRLASAVIILKDLELLVSDRDDPNLVRLSKEGKQWLKNELCRKS